MEKRSHQETGKNGDKGNSSHEECDDVNNSQVYEYKEASYKLFQIRTHKLKGSNGDYGCPFCNSKEDHQYPYIHLLLHAIHAAECSQSGKQRANHSAMAKYLAIDLAHELKSESARLSWSEDGRKLKRPRRDEASSEELDDEINDLITKERQCNDELQGARRVLMKRFDEILGGKQVNIGIKNIGELDSKFFIKELEKRFSPEIAATKGAQLCSSWRDRLKDPLWHPYEIVEDDTGKPKRLLKEDNPLLRDLKKEWGQQIYDAVVQALNELQEYNPSGCYVFPELWNFKENRKAKLEEVFSYVLDEVIEDAFNSIQETRRAVSEQIRVLDKRLEDVDRMSIAYTNMDIEKGKSAELQLDRARQELIKGFSAWHDGKNSDIGIKQMGEIDVNVFTRVCNKRFTAQQAGSEALALCRMWQQKLLNPNWNPFMMVEDDMGSSQIVVMEDDESLQSLKKEWGDEIYSAVVTALEELRDYCPSRSRTIPELWNFQENQKAELGEVISYVFDNLNRKGDY